MFSEKIRKIADAILYEGYLLYPYRASALKNRQRFNFGVLCPRDNFQAQVLIAAKESVSGWIKVRFLHLQTSQVIDENGTDVDRLELGDKIFQTWQEAIEREIDVQIVLRDRKLKQNFAFAAKASETFLNDGKAKVVRSVAAIAGAIEIEIEKRLENLFCLTIKILNQSETVESARLSNSFVSTHALLQVTNGEFISLLEFPAELSAEIANLKQNGLFAVLVERNEMLASPIILYDFPIVAPESDGDFYDATEIDELLTLRILTMTKDEKREAAQLDPRARKILAQAENSELANLHGAWRKIEKSKRELKINQKVVLKPKPGGDVFDLVLAGKTATIIRLETDFAGKTHVVVTIDDDEGKDLGWKKIVGHHFFFDPEEIEIINE